MIGYLNVPTDRTVRPISFTPTQSAALLADARNYGYTGPVTTPAAPVGIPQIGAPTAQTGLPIGIAANPQVRPTVFNQMLAAYAPTSDKMPKQTIAAAPVSYPKQTAEVIGSNGTTPYTNPVAPMAANLPPVTATQSVMNNGFVGSTQTAPLIATSNTLMRTPQYAVDSLDIGAETAAAGRRYADFATRGYTPVVSLAVQAKMNQMMARNAMAANAHTNAAEANAMQRAINDPTLRNRADAIAAAEGISVDLALKKALAGTLYQQGNYGLANRYAASTYLPAAEVENQRRIAYALQTGADTPAMVTEFGSPFQSQNINSVHGADGGVQVNTSAFSGTLSPNAALEAGMLHGSSNPYGTSVEYANTGAQNRANFAVSQQQAARNQANDFAKVQEQIRQAAQQQARAQSEMIANQYRNLKAENSLAPRPLQARPANDVQRANALISMARQVVETNPELANTYRNQAAALLGVDTSAVE